MTAVLIFIAIFVLIMTGTITLGLTVWTPALTLSGNSLVTPGSELTLHGSSFLPGSSVTLVLDSNIPIYYIQAEPHSQFAQSSTQLAGDTGQLFAGIARGKNILSALSNGTFSIAFLVDPSWSPGPHTIHASEAVTHRSAALTFTIAGKTSTVTPTPPPTLTPTEQPSATPTVAATPTLGITSTPTPTQVVTPPPNLSCANPGTLTLGALSEYSSQTSTSTVTLCASGYGTLTWSASWNVAWLKLSQTSGSIQAPSQMQVTLTASSANLAAGNYTTTITFTSPQSGSTQRVGVSLTVKAGCLTLSPGRMVFRGVAGISDPAASQTITVTNCGLTSDWSASVATANKWLTYTPGRGTLKGGASGTITVSASNLKAGLAAGSYLDQLSVKLGSQTSTVSIDLLVSAAPTISVNPTSINSNQCASSGANAQDSLCTITLTNSSTDAALTWSSSVSPADVTVQASSQTIAAGSTEQVTFTVPFSHCGQTVTVTFNGPSNAATVSWICNIIS